MTLEEIETYEEQHRQIMCQTKPSHGKLAELALKVGATTQAVDYATGSRRPLQASVSQLSHNIQQVLQTASMIDACRTATMGYTTAVVAIKKATTNGRIVVGIALLAMLAAWAAVVVMWFTKA